MEKESGKLITLQVQVQEIKEDIKELKSEMKEGFADIKDNLGCYVQKVQYDADMKSLSDRIKGVDNETQHNTGWREWIIRAILVAIIGALIGVIFKGAV